MDGEWNHRYTKTADCKEVFSRSGSQQKKTLKNIQKVKVQWLGSFWGMIARKRKLCEEFFIVSSHGNLHYLAFRFL